ncbi:hypothetical protein [Nocardia vinacea]|uniref:hypothetical protein n=1 Tax=Nocardia vinacea TaxID=96468 RepID=UPI001FDEA9BD|nr:hypothetical protein [Nocardia vinacea]
MSVSLTEGQVRARTKTVTRRMGWLGLEPGTRLTLCRKVMGRRRGEPLVRIVDVVVEDVRRERLALITAEDVRAEGFPDWTPNEFVAFFCRSHRGCTPETTVTRIQWRYLADDTATLAGVDPSIQRAGMDLLTHVRANVAAGYNPTTQKEQ